MEKERSVKILMDNTDEIENSVDLNLDDFRNTYKSNFAKSDITSEFDFTVDGRFKSNHVQQKRSFINHSKYHIIIYE